MIVYFALPIMVYFFCLVTASKKVDKLDAWFLYSIIFVCLVILAGFRGLNVARDYDNYVTFFYMIRAGESIPELSEPSYYYIVGLVTSFSDSYLPVFVIYAFLGVFFKMLSFERILGIKSSFLAVIIYISNFYILHEMTQIRIGLASGFFLLAIPYIVKRNFFKYVVLILIGTFFHLSILITIPLYFIESKKIKPLFWLGLLVINLLFYIFHLSLMDLALLFTPESYKIKIYAYKTFMLEATNDTNIRFVNRFLLYLILNLFLLYHWKRLAKESPYFIILLKLSFVSLSTAFFFYDFYLFAFRFSELIGVVQICLFAFVAFTFNNKLFGVTVVLLLTIFLLIINILLTGLLQPYYFA
jgi:hypothetical protein